MTPAEKTRAVADAWRTHPGRGIDGRITIGGLTIGHLEATEVDGVPCVQVWPGPRQGPPAWRIVNPPLLVPDPRGDVELPAARGTRRYRTDPLAALAATITGRSSR